MCHFVMRISAYDCLDQINYMIMIRDYDSLEDGRPEDVLLVSGAMPGSGAADPTRWLRGLLEDMRERM